MIVFIYILGMLFTIGFIYEMPGRTNILGAILVVLLWPASFGSLVAARLK